ncbi:MAG: carboxypeptidase-like regulatory domain-containing protein, partial [Polaribacter sp.]
MIKIFLSIFFVCCLFSTTKAQDCTFTFKGKITDFHDNTPITGASVNIINLNKFTTSNLEGKFEFKSLCAQKIILEIKHVSCDTKRITINLDKNIYKEIFLEHHLNELNEIVVKTTTKTEKTSIEQSIKKDIINNFTDKSL